MERHGKHRRDVESEPSRKSVQGLASRLMREGQAHGFQVNFLLVSLIVIVGGAMAIFGSFGYFAVRAFKHLFLQQEWLLAILDVIALVAITALAGGWFYVIANLNLWLCRPFYRKYWRSEFAVYFSRLPHRIADIADRLASLDEKELNGYQFHGGKAIAELLQNDDGLSFYVTAQRLLESS